ncbi:MAG TPA: PSD1 and planctomycete cytochrome C domain-containing protein, partial [Pirellulales bacterium]
MPTLDPAKSLALMVVSFAVCALAGAPQIANANDIDFRRDVQPIFVQHCYVCHGPSKSESGLRLDQRDRLFQGGDSGPAIVKGHSDQSRLIQYVTGKNDDKIVMPPPGKAPPLSPQDIDLLKAWIDQGALWPEVNRAMAETDAAGKERISDHWAYQPVAPVKPPQVRDPWIDTPIDAFILARLREHQLAPNTRASKIDLIRRLTLDLTGLPPTPEESQKFIADKSADAYEQLVDRLLASPHYGEQWARHWLDLARYADSDGFENDTDRPNAYKYRDYVIRAFNDDKPYDQFVVEQLAGDELKDARPEQLIATGFCRNGPTIGNQINEKNRVDEIDDVTSTTASVFLGMTLGCARCHDHKYEPITQRDYYRMFAVFDNLKKSGDQEILHIVDTDQSPRRTYVMLGGDFARRGEEVQPGVPAMVDNQRAYFPATGVADRRLALAHWIADPQNPLTARVIVNRLWLYHFGRGLVNSPSNFGQGGDPPTHGELMDDLAGELVRNGWRLKPLQKLIVMSAAYRQSSSFNP